MRCLDFLEIKVKWKCLPSQEHIKHIKIDATEIMHSSIGKYKKKNIMNSKYLTTILSVSAVLVLISCSTPSTTTKSEVSESQTPVSSVNSGVTNTDKEPAGSNVISSKNSSEEDQTADEPFVRVGSGQFLAKSAPKSNQKSAAGNITLNFEAVDLREIVKVIFEEILTENYLIDPKVQGVATLHTTNPVTADAVLPILESVLELNGVGIVYDDDIYKVLPLADVNKKVKVPTIGNVLPSSNFGFGVQIVPLQFVSAKDIKKILESVSSDTKTVRIDESRNLVILSGTQKKISNLLETIKMFDVDWLKGMSFGMFPLQHADASTLTGEMSKIIGSNGDGPLSGIVKLIPIDRMNSVLVITHQPRYLDMARDLIEKFDLGTDAAPGRRLFVYRLKHAQAENIASVLQEIYGNAAQNVLADNKRPLPPAERSNISSPVASAITPTEKSTSDQSPAPVTANQPTNSDVGGSNIDSSQGPVTIIAHKDNNSILILSSVYDFRSVEATIRQLDVAPRQVLIEATIAEVKLNDNLNYGVRWFLEGNIGNYAVNAGLNTPIPAAVAGEGLTLGLLDSTGQVKLMFDLLDVESSVKFLSSPHLMVLDNQTATIRVGDQIPIVTRSSQSTTDPDAPIVTEVQFRDTGTLLTVTPRIKEGGMLTMEISQEVSLPGTEPAVGGGGNVSISQRTIETTVIVHSGQTVVLGGLIREANTVSKSGIPGLQYLPWLGPLFGTTSKAVDRTELIITLRPRVIENPEDAYDIAQEIRTRMSHANAVEEDLRKPDDLPIHSLDTME